MQWSRRKLVMEYRKALDVTAQMKAWMNNLPTDDQLDRRARADLSAVEPTGRQLIDMAEEACLARLRFERAENS